MTSNGNIMIQYNTDESDIDDDVTSQNTIQVEPPIPSLMDDKDSEDDMDEEPINMERMMDDLTINDISEREKHLTMNEDGPIIHKDTLEDIESLWQEWSSDSNSDIFSIADLIQDMYCTEAD